MLICYILSELRNYVLYDVYLHLLESVSCDNMTIKYVTGNVGGKSRMQECR